MNIFLTCLFILESVYALDLTSYLGADAYNNTMVLNKHIEDDAYIVINDTFSFYPGVYAFNKTNVTIDLQGVMNFSIPSRDEYPYGTSLFRFDNMNKFTFTSTTQTGIIYGGGSIWYGYLDLVFTDEKPILFDMSHSKSSNIELSHVTIIEPPYWSTYIKADYVHVHHVTILARPDDMYHGDFYTVMRSVSAFNTDGIDVEGDNVYIHDCNIHVGDDCVAVKGGNNWLVENMNVSGLGLSIGKHGHANNITFRNIYMKDTVRAIYVKAHATNILYENITVDYAFFFPIWIGPAYQFFNGDCPLTWPLTPTKYLAELSDLLYDDPLYLNGLCGPSDTSYSRNITLRNVYIKKSESTPIVMIGNENMQDVYIDNVTIENAPAREFPFSNETKCYNATINGELCNEAGYCLEEGDRDAIQPCCTKYDPEEGGYWGMCQ